MRPVFWGVTVWLAAVGCWYDTYVDPAEAGPDWRLQGEYLDAADGSWGAQIVALGEGRFRAVLLLGGLPGAGADPEWRQEAEGETDGGATRFAFPSGARGELRPEGLSVILPNGEARALARTQRQSVTLGAKPPPSAVVLFDGSDTDAFEPGAEMTERGTLAAGATTTSAFGSFTLHLEFRTPFMPTAEGQMRGNSGLYLQDRYEVQVLDSFGGRGESNECGGIYEQRRPDVNMALPPLEWQTYDIDFAAARFDAQGEKRAPARVTVRHNGVLIHDDVELTEPTGMGDPEGPEPGKLTLQDHWNPVEYRNVWLVERN